MKEVIDSILTAEQMAEQIILDANESAKKINADRDLESEKAKTLASLSFAAERKKALKDAQKRAEELYQKEMEKANAEADKLKQSVADKKDKIVDSIVDGLIK
jgi:vacuolar-type H+-ATPase subunit E/Vma4